MDPEFSGLITTGSHYPPVTGTAYDQGPALQPGILQILHRYKKGIQVKMSDMSVRF
jgi:hypothetical protein